MKKWGKRIVSGIIAVSLLAAASASRREPGEKAVVSIVQAGTETSFMGRLLEGEYIDVFTSWSAKEQNQFFDSLSAQERSVFIEVTNYQVIKQLVKTGTSKKGLDELFRKLEPYFQLLKRENEEKAKEPVVLECINQIEKTEYPSADVYLKQLIPEKDTCYMEFYFALKEAGEGKQDIPKAADQLYEKLGLKEEEKAGSIRKTAAKSSYTAQQKSAAKAVSDGFSNFKSVSSVKEMKDAVDSVKKGEKLAVRIDKGFNVTSVIKTNGRHVKIYADSASGHNLNRTASYKGAMIEVNGGSLTLGAYDGDGRAKNTLYINGKNVAAAAPLIKVSSGQLYLNKYSCIKDGYYLADFAGGGGISLESGASCYMFGGKIDGCSAASSKDVSSSSPKSSHGGGIVVNDGASFYMFSGSIERCKAVHGGGIMVYGTARLYGGVISDCAAVNKKNDALGGAVKVQGAFSTDGKITAVKGDFAVWKYTRSGSWSVNGKDGYEQVSTAGVTLKKNRANAGGAVCVNNGSKGTIQDCSIYDNSSTGNGAGICLSNGSYKKGASLEIKKGAGIHGNVSSGYGGGIYCADSVKGSISGGTVYENTASYGAGVYHEGEFLLSGGTIRNNGSNNSGGGLYAKGRLVMNGGEISANSAKTYGGGAIIKSAGGTISGGQIKNNSAAVNGGGLQLDGQLTVSNAAVTDNTAAQNGGGLSISTVGRLQMKSGTVSGNTAKVSGGGISADGTCKVNGSNFTGNKSYGDGGAVYVGSGTFTTFQANQAVKIEGNSAAKNGAGIYNKNVTVLNNNAHILMNECKNGTEHNVFHEGSLFSVEGYTEIKQEVYLAKDRFITASSKYFSSANSLTMKISMENSNLRNGYAAVKGDISNTGDSSYKTGDTLLHNQAADGRFVYTGSGYTLRPGNFKKASAGCVSYSVVLSRVYKICYDKNSKEEVRNMPASADKYWEEDLKLSELTPSEASGNFLAWNTKPDGTGNGYQPGNLYTANEDATLFALWPRYKVEYLPGIQGTSGATQSQEQNKSEDIFLRKNGFQSSEGKFICWKQDTYKARKRNELEATGYIDLKAERNTQEQNYIYEFSKNVRKSYLAGRSDIKGSLLDADDIFVMKGQWDFKPDILLKDKKSFIENEKVDRTKLLELVESCHDVEDGDLMQRVKITEIQYGMTKKGMKPENQKFSDGMKSTDLMNTYFMMLDKNETVNIKVFFQVKDSAGNITEKEGAVCVVYNNPPKLHSYNLAFYQKDLEIKPKAVLKEITDNCQAEDLEDDKQGLNIPVSIVEPVPLEIEKIKSAGKHKIIYRAVDSLGKETKLESEVYIAQNSPYIDSYFYRVRFINKEYLYTLDQNSKWKKDPELNNKLVTQLEKTGNDAVISYKFRSKK
ncbi:hypothetical protein [Anaerostipes sp.]|uniref:hypothetical protein n=1 Tax=Anaerostipes sp. TaxID=1872530 RepID=UPI0025B98C41|nr:hypothetical protein [Anaerostipes sp.]MBS7006968.1 hypothetical protein [Anaerostipes sp.]